MRQRVRERVKLFFLLCGWKRSNLTSGGQETSVKRTPKTSLTLTSTTTPVSVSMSSPPTFCDARKHFLFQQKRRNVRRENKISLNCVHCDSYKTTIDPTKF